MSAIDERVFALESIGDSLSKIKSNIKSTELKTWSTMSMKMKPRTRETPIR